MDPRRKLGYIPFSERILTGIDIERMFDELREEIREKFENIEEITDPEPNTVYGIRDIQDKLVTNMNQLAELGNSNS